MFLLTDSINAITTMLTGIRLALIHQVFFAMATSYTLWADTIVTMVIGLALATIFARITCTCCVGDVTGFSPKSLQVGTMSDYFNILKAN